MMAGRVYASLEVFDDNDESEELLPTQPMDTTPDDSPRASLVREEEGDGYFLPQPRCPPVSLQHDTAYFSSDLTPISAHGYGLFVQDRYVLKRHVMCYVDCESYPASSKVVALTKDGKHIVWQQAIRSCVPTAISMIALDRGKVFLAKEITYPVTSTQTMFRYIRKAGFEPVVHVLRGAAIDKVRALEALIAQTGSGLLHLIHPDLKSHMVVLDEISLEKRRVTLREPYHGYMITISLLPFMNWIGEDFIALADQ